MKRLFIDSSVLFSAAYSPRGHARDLILMAARSELVLVISPLVLEETRRNLEESAPILAAAKSAQVDLLVTLDKKHMLDKPVLVQYLGKGIVTPKGAWQILNSKT
jgi:predicted nucleic acid-binding protein